jgi:ankyrin repeat protein
LPVGGGMSSAPLLTAARDGDRELIVKLLADGANANEADSRGWTPLLYAVLNASSPIVDLLIAAGADVNAVAPDGSTPLIKATLWGHIDIVQTLLDAGADRDRRDRAGWNALEIAEASHLTDVASLLRAASLNAGLRRNAS